MSQNKTTAIVPVRLSPMEVVDDGPEPNAHARRLAIMRTSVTEIARVTGLSSERIKELQQEVKRDRNGRLRELQARGSDVLLEDLVDLCLQSEERERQLEAHKAFDLVKAVFLQQQEADFRFNVIKVVMPKFSVAPQGRAKSVREQLESRFEVTKKGDEVTETETHRVERETR